MCKEEKQGRTRKKEKRKEKERWEGRQWIVERKKKENVKTGRRGVEREAVGDAKQKRKRKGEEECRGRQ